MSSRSLAHRATGRRHGARSLTRGAYTLQGFSAAVTTCERCGKPDLLGTFLIAGPGGVKHLGSDCAAKAVGHRVVQQALSRAVASRINAAIAKAGGVSRDVSAAVLAGEPPSRWPQGLSPEMARYLDPKDLPLFSQKQHKMDITKALFGKVVTRIMHFAPAKKSGYEVCAHRSPSCTFGCLDTAGKGALSGPQRSKANKTRAFFRAPEAFVEKLRLEVAKMAAAAKKQKRLLQLRLNGTSDIPWENYVPKSWLPLMYDYTKSVDRWRAQPYYLTLSWSEVLPQSPLEMAREAKAAGRPGVTVLMENHLRKKFLAEHPTYHGVPVVDGSTHDYRRSDPPGALILLRPLGKVIKDKRGFVVRDLDALEKPGPKSVVATPTGRRPPALRVLG